MEEPVLYIIATPLGNRNDITLRALEMLKTLPVFFAEDSRECSKLLQLYDISLVGKEIHSYAKHNMKVATDKALRILKDGQSIGFVSDRGTPAISDPGTLLVKETRALGISVIPIPGPSSVTTALSVSGFSGDRFVFLGFLPDSNKERAELWADAARVGETICFFESPKRVRQTAQELKEIFPTGTLFFAREMTKLYESYHDVLAGELDVQSLVEKGEYVVAIRLPAKPPQGIPWEIEVENRLLADKAWAKIVAERCGVSASTIYNELQRRKNRT